MQQLLSKGIYVFVGTARAREDYPVDGSFIMVLWRKHKLEDAGAKRDLLVSRSRGCLRNIEEIEQTVLRERVLTQRFNMELVKSKMQAQLCEFIVHEDVTLWKKQYDPQWWGLLMRYITLLLRGGTQQGKSVMAKHLMGEQHTLLVNCQGLGSVLPDLSRLNDPDYDYKAVVYDEITWKQVINNKQVFQAPNDMVALGQSVCNQHAYQINPYGVAMICCSNDFPMTVAEGLQSAEDEEWLKGNVAVVELPAGSTWFKASDMKPRPVFHRKYQGSRDRLSSGSERSPCAS